MRIVIDAVALVLAIVLVFVLGPDEPRPAIRRADIPPPRTLAELRPMFHAEAIVPCMIANVDVPPEWVSLTPQGLWLRLPRDWESAGPAPRFLDTAQVLRGPNGARIDVTYTPTGAIGRNYLAEASGVESDGGICEFAHDSTGSIWTIYVANAGRRIPAADDRYTAYGEVLTASGRRYQVDVQTATAQARDSLVRLVANHAAQQ